MQARTPDEVHKLFVDAFNRADLDALAALYEVDAILVTRDSKAVGRSAIRSAYQRIVAHGGHMDLTTHTVLDSGDGLALLHAAWTLQRGAQQHRGLSTEVVRQQPGGSWLFVLDEPSTPQFPVD